MPMKLLSMTEFTYRNGKFFYLGKPVVAERVNAKGGLTLVGGSKKVVLKEGVYSVTDLVAIITKP